MPHQLVWENSSDNKGVLSRYTGPFTEELHSKGLNKLFGDPKMDGIKYIIGDYSRVNGSLLTVDYVDYPVAMTTGAASYLKNIKVALVATDKDILGLCKHFIKLANSVNSSWKFQIFEDVSTARQWVNSDL